MRQHSQDMDIETGQAVAGPFKEHTHYVTSVAFSLDGKESHDSTVRIWDAETGQIVAGPFEGHTDWVASVAFSLMASKWSQDQVTIQSGYGMLRKENQISYLFQDR